MAFSSLHISVFYNGSETVSVRRPSMEGIPYATTKLHSNAGRKTGRENKRSCDRLIRNVVDTSARVIADLPFPKTSTKLRLLSHFSNTGG